MSLEVVNNWPVIVVNQFKDNALAKEVLPRRIDTQSKVSVVSDSRKEITPAPFPKKGSLVDFYA